MSLTTRRASSPRVPGETHTSPHAPVPQDNEAMGQPANSEARPSTNMVDFSDSSAATSSRPSGVKSASHRTQAFEESRPASRVVPVGGSFFMSRLRAVPRPEGLASVPEEASMSPSTSAPRPSGDGGPTGRSVSSSPGMPQESSSASSSASESREHGLLQPPPTYAEDEQPPPLQQQQESPSQRSNPPSTTNAGSLDGVDMTAQSVRSTRSLPPLSQTRGTASASVTSRGVSPPMQNEDDEYFQPFTASMRSDAGFENPQSHSPSPRTRLLCESPLASTDAEDSLDEAPEYDDDVVMRTSASSASVTQAHRDVLDDEAYASDTPEDRAAVPAAADLDGECGGGDRLASTANSVVNRYDGDACELGTEDPPIVTHFIDLNGEDEEEAMGDDSSSSAFSHKDANERRQRTMKSTSSSEADAAWPDDAPSVEDDEEVEENAQWRREPAPRNLETSEATSDEEASSYPEEELDEEVQAQEDEAGLVEEQAEESDDSSYSSASSAAAVPDVPGLPPPLPRAQPVPTSCRDPAVPLSSKYTIDMLPPPRDVYHRGSVQGGPEERLPVLSPATTSGSTGSHETTPPPPLSTDEDVYVSPITPAARAPRRQTRREVPAPETRPAPPGPTPAVDPPQALSTLVFRRYPQYFVSPLASAATGTDSAAAPAPTGPLTVAPAPAARGRRPAANQCEDCARCPHCDHSVCPECGGVMHRAQSPDALTVSPTSPRFIAYLDPSPPRVREAVVPSSQPPSPLQEEEHQPRRARLYETVAPPENILRTNPWEDDGWRPPRRRSHPRDGRLSWSTTPATQCLAPEADDHNGDGNRSCFEDDTAPELEALTRGTLPAPMTMKPAKPAPIPPPHRPHRNESHGEKDKDHDEVAPTAAYAQPARSPPRRDKFRPRDAPPYGSHPHADADDSEPCPEEAPVPTPRTSVSQSLHYMDPPDRTTASQPTCTGTGAVPDGYQNHNGGGSSRSRAPSCPSCPPAEDEEDKDGSSPPPMPPRRPTVPTYGDAPVTERTLPLDTTQRRYDHVVADEDDTLPRRYSNELPACVGPVGQHPSWRLPADTGARPAPPPRAESRGSNRSVTPSGRRSRGGAGPWLGCAPGAWDGRGRTPVSTPETTHGRQSGTYSRRSVSPYGLGSGTATTYIMYRGQTPTVPLTTGVMVPITVRAPSRESASIVPADPDEEVWRAMVRKMELEKERVHTESRLRRNGRLSY